MSSLIEDFLGWLLLSPEVYVMKRIICAFVFGGLLMLSGFSWGTSGMPDCPRQCENMCMHSAVGAAYGRCIAGCMSMCKRACKSCHPNMANINQALEMPVMEVQFFERRAPRNFLKGFEQLQDDDV